MSGGGGSPQPAGNTTTTSTSAPWSGQQPYLTSGFQQASSLFNGGQGGPQYFPGTTYSPETSQQAQAISMATNRATNGSPIDAANSNGLISTLNGSYLDPNTNPGLQSAIDTTKAAVQPGIDSQFEGAGRYGSPLAARAAAGGVTDAIGNLTFGTYNNERARQIQASALAPTAANQDFTNISQLSNAGTQAQSLGQQDINSNINRYNYNQNLPWNTLANYMGMINGNYGGSSTTTQPYFGASGSSNALGGALGGAAMGSMFGPWGAAAGGGLGLLSSLKF